MRAIVCTEDGPPESLKLVDLPTPEPGRGEVRLRVHAAGVNFPDGLAIAGRYQMKKAHPFVPGQEASGIVDAIGEGVVSVQVGDRAATFGGWGAYAEYVIAPERLTAKLGRNVALDAAAGFASAYGTGQHAFRQRAELEPGQTVLVLGAGGGVGHAAVQLAKLIGATVIAAASSEEKLSLARGAGADHCVNYSVNDLRAAIKEIVGGRGVDIIYDPVGGKLSEQAFRSLAWNGRHLVVGFAAGEIPKLPLNLALLKGASAVGVYLGGLIDHEPELHRRNLIELFGWLNEGRLKPHIGARYPLAQTGEAIRHVIDGGALGKILVTMT
jgi:NADPH:quinone reductase